jgi:hypothetical protein
MQPLSKRRLVGGAAALMLIGATLLSTAGVAVASPPHWVMDVVPLPSSVTPGADAGYQVTITNNGPSNISTLFLVTSPTAGSPVYVDDSGDGRNACTDPGVPLSCSFGALNAGEHVTVIVGYTTSGSGSFNPVFEGTTSGTSFQDPKRSHGDILIDNDFTGTVLNSNKNFGGGFTKDNNGSIGNNDQLNGNNKQSTKVTHLPGGIAATVEDGPTTSGTCTPDTVVTCDSFVGEWSVINVAGGADLHPGYFILQVHYKAGTGTPTVFVHSANGPYAQEDILPCAGGVFDGVTSCFTWDAGTNTATIYLFHNGSVRGL